MTRKYLKSRMWYNALYLQKSKPHTPALRHLTFLCIFKAPARTIRTKPPKISQKDIDFATKEIIESIFCLYSCFKSQFSKQKPSRRSKNPQLKIFSFKPILNKFWISRKEGKKVRSFDLFSDHRRGRCFKGSK